MALNAPLLRSSFEVVIEREPQLTEVFYGKPFERSPIRELMVSGACRSSKASS